LGGSDLSGWRDPPSSAENLGITLTVLILFSFFVSSSGNAFALPTGESSDSGGANGTSPFPTPIQHVVIVMMENQNYEAVGKQGPFESYLAKTYAAATDFYSPHHYSIPAYLAATSGTDGAGFYLRNGSNLGDLMSSAGLSWAAFEQGMPYPCDSTSNWLDGYDADHNPFVMYRDIATNASRCDARDLTWSSWNADVARGKIPNYSFVTPNTTDDDHNASIPVGDAWLKSWLSPLINDTAIFSRTAFILTYDESANDSSVAVNGSSGGQVYTVVVSPYSRGLTSSAFYNTFSLLTTTEWLLGLRSGTMGTDNWTLHPPLKPLFSFATYPVSFEEAGLPRGTNWSLSVGSATRRSSSEVRTLELTDGQYSYLVGNVTNYSRTSPGTFSVDGSGLNVTIQFTLVKYGVMFKETGLPAGASWSVAIGAVDKNSSAGAVSFDRGNGTFSYVASTDAPGYSANPGDSSVNGASLVVWIAFYQTS
jgi:Phosphoesterase family